MKEKKKRVQLDRSDGNLSISIASYKDESKQKMLTVWLVLWTLSGIVIGLQLFSDYSRQEKLFMGIWMAFWAYFEFKVVKAYRWRKDGREVIRMDDEYLVYYRETGGRSLPSRYRLDMIRKIKEYEPEMNSLTKVMNDSYWVISGEKLAVEHGGKTIPFGLRLEKNEVKKIIKAMQGHLKEYEKNTGL